MNWVGVRVMFLIASVVSCFFAPPVVSFLLMLGYVVLLFKK
jgi:hypothetical protein